MADGSQIDVRLNGQWLGQPLRWWPRDLEIPCPDWREAALGLEGSRGWAWGR